jgi:hypothetical protein
MPLPNEKPDLGFAYLADGRRKFLDGRPVYRLKQQHSYARDGFIPFVIPQDFETDLSSVPRWLACFISPSDEGFAEAGIIHDWLYRNGPLTRANADLLFRELLIEWHVSWWKAWAAYIALRIFGARNYTTTRGEA